MAGTAHKSCLPLINGSDATGTGDGDDDRRTGFIHCDLDLCSTGSHQIFKHLSDQIRKTVAVYCRDECRIRAFEHNLHIFEERGGADTGKEDLHKRIVIISR